MAPSRGSHTARAGKEISAAQRFTQWRNVVQDAPLTKMGLKRRGGLLGKGGFSANVLRLSPPLNAAKAELDELDEALDPALALARRKSRR